MPSKEVDTFWLVMSAPMSLPSRIGAGLRSLMVARSVKSALLRSTLAPCRETDPGSVSG
jgi:hypothetical protein